VAIAHKKGKSFMELASQLSIISVVIGSLLIVYGLVRYFRERAEQKRRQRSEQTSDEP
jgi:membrane protein implicated in regulation of membrane protease activity